MFIELYIKNYNFFLMLNHTISISSSCSSLKLANITHDSSILYELKVLDLFNTFFPHLDKCSITFSYGMVWLLYNDFINSSIVFVIFVLHLKSYLLPLNLKLSAVILI